MKFGKQLAALLEEEPWLRSRTLSYDLLKTLRKKTTGALGEQAIFEDAALAQVSAAAGIPQLRLACINELDICSPKSQRPCERSTRCMLRPKGCRWGGIRHDRHGALQRREDPCASLRKCSGDGVVRAQDYQVGSESRFRRDICTLPIAALKDLIVARGLRHGDCIERRDLIWREVPGIERRDRR